MNKNIIKKIKALLFLAVFLFAFSFTLSVPSKAEATYTAKEFGQDFSRGLGEFLGGIFGGGDQISFTQYEGQLAELSPEGYDASLTSSTNLRDFILRIVNFALGFLGLAAVIVIIYGGVLYVISGGDDDKITTGKKAIQYATIGLIIIMGSFAFVNTVIKGAITGTDTNESTRLLGTGQTVGGFNASSEQVKAIAYDIYTQFSNFASSIADLEGIELDSRKASLNIASYPSKSEITTFLFSMQNKIENLKNGRAQFGEIAQAADKQLKSIETTLDLVRSSGRGYVKVDGTTVKDCSLSNPPGNAFQEGFEAGIKPGGNPCEDDSYTLIDGGATSLRAWQSFQSDNLNCPAGRNCVFTPLFTALQEEYLTSFETNVSSLNDIYQSLKQIEAVGAANSEATREFIAMMTAYVGNAPTQAGPINPQGGHYNDVKSLRWTGEGMDIVTAGQGLLAGLTPHGKFYDQLRNIQFVQAKIIAGTIEGNAPLPVIFDVGDSVDPAGGTINGENVYWDPAGTQAWNAPRNIKISGGKPQSREGSDATIRGDQVFIPTDDTTISCPEDTGLIGNKSILRCVYKKPGTYLASVYVKSAITEQYGPGISFIKIKVNPPTTKIDLTMKPSATSSDIFISKYQDEVQVIGRNTVAVTLEEAKSGITFNATDGPAGSAIVDTTFRWDFGNGELTQFADGSNVKTSYTTPGTYRVMVESLNKLGQSDRLIFSLKVTNTVARVSESPKNESTINSPVIFDASISSASGGIAIRNYAWKITKLDAAGAEVDVNSESSDRLSSLTYTFKAPGKYRIYLTITDSSGQTTSLEEPLSYIVHSQNPQSLFNYGFPSTNQPGTVLLDGSDSFDPDGLDEESLDWQWTITPEGATDAPNFGDVSPADWDNRRRMIKVYNAGEYEVKLRVTDKNTIAFGNKQEFNEINKKVQVGNVLDIAWGADQQSTIQINSNIGRTEDMEFFIVSRNATAYEIDFGDGEIASGGKDEFNPLPNAEENIAVATHSYAQAGRYTVKATVYDDNDNDNSVQRRVFVKGGDSPIANIGLYVNDAKIDDLSEENMPIVVSRTDNLRFDAGESINSDGTARKLAYSWEFGDTGRSSKKQENHQYTELSPKDSGYYTIKLKVYDQDNPSKEDTDEIKINIVAMPPKFSSVQAIPVSTEGNPVTPVTVNLKVYGAEDPDGQITKYKWWYFDVDDPQEQLGLQVTTIPGAQLTIGTNGKEGNKVTYGFGLEVTDVDNLTFCNLEYCNADLPQSVFSSIQVTNGPNEPPVAKFSVDVVKVYTGDLITFTSGSTDKDGRITRYIWDVEGDGFFNNESTDKAVLEYRYSQKNLDGYPVRLKVIDDKGGESISEPITVFVDSRAQKPKAAFKYEVVPGSEGKKVRFINNSTADEKAGAKIIRYEWDFDIASNSPGADSDGDGQKDNDVDSTTTNPERLYTTQGSYKVKLKITDDQGNTDEVSNEITVPLANPPVAAFTYELQGDSVVFTNNSTADANSGSEITKYLWDFDTASELITADSNGDGKKDNDQDSTTKNPVKQYDTPGTYKVKLTVIDNQGNSDDVTNDVVVKFVPLGNTGNTGNMDTNNTANIKAVLVTDPAPAADGMVYLSGDTGSITFDFSRSTGSIAYYSFDKNILFDTNGDGINNNDDDFKTGLPGRWKTNFAKAWGRTVVQLTVTDIYGNKNAVTMEIKFR